MPRFPPPTTTDPQDHNARRPNVQVKIGGRIRSDAYPSSIIISGGFSPGTAVIEFPRAAYGSEPARPRDKVEIKIGGTIVFKGWINEPEEAEDKAGDMVKMTARDLRSRLNDAFAPRSFNLRDTRKTIFLEGDNTEGIGSRAVIRSLMDSFNDFTTASQPSPVTMEMDVGSIPDDYPGTLQIQGQMIDQALGGVVSRLSESFIIRLNYDRGDRLEAVGLPDSSGTQYQSRRSRRFNVVRGSDMEAIPRAQPWGVANAKPTRSKSYDITNILTVRGAPKIIETMRELDIGWDDDGSVGGITRGNALANWTKYTTPPTKDIANPDFKPWITSFFRRYQIPKITVTTDQAGTLSSTLQVPILPRLVREDPFSASGEAMQPFLLVKWPGVAAYDLVLGDRFSITDDTWVELNEPLISQDTAATGVITYTIPEEVWLNFAYQANFGLEHTTTMGQAGSAKNDIVQTALEESPQFRWEALVEAADLTTIPVPESGDGPADTSETVIDDSSATEALRSQALRLSDYATQRIAQTREPNDGLTVLLERGDVSARVGDRIWENGWDTRALIAEVHHDLGTSEKPVFKTTITGITRL